MSLPYFLYSSLSGLHLKYALVPNSIDHGWYIRGRCAKPSWFLYCTLGISLLLHTLRSVTFNTVFQFIWGLQLSKVQNHLCFQLAHFLKCKVNRYLQKLCKTILFTEMAQKWMSLCIYTPHSLQKCDFRYRTKRNTSFNRQLSISMRFTRITPKWANIAQVKSLLLKLK